MTVDFRIRTAVYQDIPHLSRLLAALFSLEKDFTPDELKQQRGLAMMLGPGDQRVVLVAEAERRVVGMCTAQILISTAEGGPAALIEDLVVDAGFRGQGIGSSLLRKVECWAMEKGVQRLQLLADRDNLSALEFYRKIGWQHTRLICLRKK